MRFERRRDDAVGRDDSAGRRGTGRGRRGALIGAALLLPVAAGGFMLQRQESADGARLFSQVFARVVQDAVDPISQETVYERAARGLVENLDDPYADLYSPEELARFTRNSLGNAYGGIGVLIEDQRGTFIVSKVYPDTPAAAGGVQLGDRFVAVDGAPVAGLKLDEISGRLVGREGTPVAVTFARAGVAEPIVARLTRARVSVPAVPYAMMLDAGIGYIPLQRFNETSASEVERALERLTARGASSFILDLRGNTGGDFDESLAVANLFLPKGEPIVSVRTRGTPPVTSIASRDPEAPSAPLVVLTDGFSASASEIVAGALQDHDRAVLIGTTTFGKGLVQSVFSLQGGWALKLTTGRWYTPSGRSIQRERVERDGRLVEATPDSLETDSVRAARPTFRSDRGRLVYGGGGITPDLIIPADTISTAEQAFVKAIAPKSQQSYIALYGLALELRKSAAPGFRVDAAWREAYWERLAQAGVEVERAKFDAAARLVDRMLETQVTSLAFGDSAVVRRTLPYDSQLGRAVAILKEGSLHRSILAGHVQAPRRPTG